MFSIIWIEPGKLISAETKKWAFAHWCVSPILILHNSFQCLIYAGWWEKTIGGGEGNGGIVEE
jgi:hypothetical protein